MNTKGFPNSASIMRLVMIFSIFSSAFGIFLLYKLDTMVHGDLYYYGLQASYDWILPMWTFERLLGVCLILPMVFSSGFMVWDLLKSRKQVPPVKHVDHVEHVEVPKPQPPQPLVQQKQPTPAPSVNNGVKAQALRENSMVISCPSCKKVFGKPLVMLDFSGKKTRFINVCPYCNAVLGKASDEDECASNNVGILDADKRVEERR